MKTLRFALLALLLAIGLAGAAHAQVSADIHIGPGGRAAVDLGYFYDDLASYGNWIERPSYGWVWTPRSVAASWQPYQSGHWVATDQGWTWVTAEPYGWATYHYGRWYDDPEIGWSWVPGNDWAPSWVSWQEGNNYIGWAPLPPSVTIASGFNGLVSVSLAPAVYLFVPERDFLAPSLGSYYVPRDRVDTIYRGTRNLTNYDYSGGRVYNRGVSVDRIQQVVGRPVTRYQLSDLRTRGAARVQGNQVQVFRPQVQRANVQAPSARPIAKKAVVDAAQFRQSHPDRAGNRAVAQGAAPAAAQPKPARPVKVNPAQQPDRSGQNPPTQATRPRARNQASQPVEATPPARQRKANQPPPEQQTERPAAQPKHQRQPATQQQTPPPAARERQPRVQPQQDRQQRPPQATPPPKRQAQPQEKRQQQPPPPQNQQRQQRQEPPKDKPQQDDRKPPQR